MGHLHRNRFVEHVLPVRDSHGHVRPLTPEQAKHLFDELAADSEIPFNYPDDCCFSRAHKMCRTMQDRGIPCRKVWNYGHGFPSGAPLRVKTPNGPDGPNGSVNWRYHVAPVVQVQGPHGATQDRVMDPSIFHHPVTVDEWVRIQNDLDPHGHPRSTHEITDPKYYFRTPGNAQTEEDPDGSKTKTRLAEHRAKRDARRVRRTP